MRRIMGVLLAVTLVACGGGGSTALRATVTGSGGGDVGTQHLAIHLSESSGSVTGSGTLSGSDIFALTIQGSFNSPSLSVTMTSGLHPAINMTATLAGST